MKCCFTGRELPTESIGAVILFLMALAALILCNSPLGESYQHFWQAPLGFHYLEYSMSQSTLFWVNEGLMTLFFVLIGLELKREFLRGALSEVSQVVLPGLAALGGMLVPALIFGVINYTNDDTIVGWAVPVATDIAFALGVLSLFGKRVPPALKMFLLALAIFDDVGAIIIIAVFHLESLSYLSFLCAFLFIFLLWLMNKYGVRSLSLYLLVGLGLWICVLNSGIHATVAGVLLAFFIPLTGENSPLSRLEKTLHPLVTFFIMPLFALANAGVPLAGLSSSILLDRVVIGTSMGLFLGKQLGVMAFVHLCVKLGWAKLPKNTTWLEVYGVAILCGIGFTMSLFLATLAFKNNSAYLVEARLGILSGSILSGLIGAAILHLSFNRKSKGVSV
jgi:NhaA family Na+:H+ antiporter